MKKHTLNNTIYLHVNTSLPAMDTLFVTNLSSFTRAFKAFQSICLKACDEKVVLQHNLYATKNGDIRLVVNDIPYGIPYSYLVVNPKNGWGVFQRDINDLEKLPHHFRYSV